MSAFSAKRDIAIADQHMAGIAHCLKCGAQTSREDLGTFGARCRPCYLAYCAEANPKWWPNRALTADERKSVIRKAHKAMANIGVAGPPKGIQVAINLKAMHDSGEKLSSGQKDFWRRVFGNRPPAPMVDADEAIQ